MNWLKFKDIDWGTKLRTIGAIIVAINQAIATLAPPDFGSEAANGAYKIISYLFSFAALVINTYYNNDYTEEASVGTTATRLLKADPTAVIAFDVDADEDDDDDDEDETDGDEAGDEIIKGGE